MSAALVWIPTASLLVAGGLAALILQAELMRKLLAFNVMGAGIFIFILLLAPRGTDGRADPIAQALLLTGIVIAIAATSLGLLLARRYHALTGRASLPDADAAAHDRKAGHG